MRKIEKKRKTKKLKSHFKVSKNKFTVSTDRKHSVPKLGNIPLINVPGLPQLPAEFQYCLIPANAEIKSINIKTSTPHYSGIVENPLPGTEFRVYPNEKDKLPDTTNTYEIECGVNYNLFKGNGSFPEKQVSIVSETNNEYFKIVVLRISPVQYDSIKKNYRFYKKIEYEIVYEVSSKPAAKKRIGSHRYDFYRKLFDCKQWLIDSAVLHENLYTRFPEKIPYVIITDNYSWQRESISTVNGKTRAPNIS